MAIAQKKSAGQTPGPQAGTAKVPDIGGSSIPDTLTALRVNSEAGLTSAEVEIRRKEHGYNEVAEKKEHPLLRFLSKFWGLSAWMLELIMVLSAFLRKLSDLSVVTRTLRDSKWQVIPARELVPGDIVRVRSGDIIPAVRNSSPGP